MSGSLLEIAFDFARAIIALFIIVDPFGDIPIFITLTEKMAKGEKRRVFNTATIVGLILLLVFSLTGQEIFAIFGISVYAFEVAGGILLLIIAIRILISGSMQEKSESPESLGAVPIAMPLLVGPGAITTTILNLQLYGVATAAGAAIVVVFITWIILRFMNSIYQVLGKTGSLIIARVVALLIAAIATQYILVGITHYLTMGH
ncbi:MAG TPA: MarC family protein [Candidatus Acidoferrum sp.]|nr:MarC family protein [Candidatus Acidoferrum sp.]